MKAVVVVGRGYPNLLSMVYEAGVAGADVYVVRPDYPSGGFDGKFKRMGLEQYSKYLKKIYAKNTKNNEVEIWKLIQSASCEISNTGQYEKIVFLPTDDRCALILNQHKDDFSQMFVFNGIGRNGRGDYAWLANKARQKSLAKRYGIDVAEGVEINLNSSGCQGEYGGPFPCVIKIARSIDFYTPTKGIVAICKTRQSLDDTIESIRREKYVESVIVEQLLPIEKQFGLAGVCSDGHVLGMGCFRKDLVGSGERVGVTVTGAVVDVASISGLFDFENRVHEMMEGIGYNGMFDIDIIYSNEKYYLVEINVRVGAFAFSVVNAGVDFISLYLRTTDDLRGNQVVRPNLFGVKALNERALLEEFAEGKITAIRYFYELWTAPSRKIRNVLDCRPYDVFTQKAHWGLLKHFLLPVIAVRRAYRRLREQTGK